MRQLPWIFRNRTCRRCSVCCWGWDRPGHVGEAACMSARMCTECVAPISGAVAGKRRASCARVRAQWSLADKACMMCTSAAGLQGLGLDAFADCANCLARAASLGNLTHLEELDLSGNKFHGYGRTHALLHTSQNCSTPHVNMCPACQTCVHGTLLAGAGVHTDFFLQEAPLFIVTVCMVRWLRVYCAQLRDARPAPS